MRVLQLCALIALCVCASGRTVQRQPSVGAQITSLADKDARQKASVHPAFANAGRQAGVQVWRIENFNPVAVAQNDYGKFYKGDSYIVLKTTKDNRNNLSWDIYYWIGSESSQDESGAAAILTVGLDDKFNGAAVQHREVLGQESQQFRACFPGGISYVNGGVASGFNHVVTNAGAEKRLIQVKGKRNVRVRQVDPQISSMNKGDCFILDVGNDILVYVGSQAKNVEKLKANSVATQIRDEDHHGRGRVETIDQYSSDVDYQRFFTALGSGSKDLVPEESAGGDDQAFERNEEQVVTLTEVSDRTGSVKVTPLSKPYRQEQLNTQDCYVLDTVTGSIYVWCGKQASDRERTEAGNKAQQIFSSKNYPSWVQKEIVRPGSEPAIFKQYFATWRDAGMAHNRVVRSFEDFSNDLIDQEFARPKQEDQVRLYEATLMSDNHVNFVETPDYRQPDLSQDEVNVLIAGDQVYVWLGKETSVQERKAGILIGEAFAEKYNVGPAIVTVIKQELEPDHFINQFQKWDPFMWQKQRVYEEDKANAMRTNDIEPNDNNILVN